MVSAPEELQPVHNNALPGDILGWRKRVWALHREAIETVFYLTYMGLLLIDAFRVLLPLTMVMSYVLRPKMQHLRKKTMLLQAIFAFVALRCFLAGIIPETKIFIIYIFALHAGEIMAPLIARCASMRMYLYFAIMGGLFFTLRALGIELASNIEADELINNYAEVVTFSMLAQMYMRGSFSESARWSTSAVSLLSGSKFLMINQAVMNITRKWYPMAIVLIVAVLFWVNPSGFLSSRLGLYEIFLQHMNGDRFWLRMVDSVNDWVRLESTIYSFHDIWFDYLWYGGVMGVAAIFLHMSLLVGLMRSETLLIRCNIIVMYILCITFGFSVFFGTKYMFLMLGVMLAAPSRKSLSTKAEERVAAPYAA